VQPLYLKQKINSASFFLSLVRLAEFRAMFSGKLKLGIALNEILFDYVFRLEIYPIHPTCRSYWPLSPSLFIRRLVSLMRISTQKNQRKSAVSAGN